MSHLQISKCARVVATIVIALGTLSCAARGQRAVEAMTPDQREFVAHSLTSFTPNSTALDLDAAFGVPLEASMGRRLWKRAGAAPGERIEAWFEEGRLVRLRVFDLGDRACPSWAPVWSWDLVARADRLAPLSP